MTFHLVDDISEVLDLALEPGWRSASGGVDRRALPGATSVPAAADRCRRRDARVRSGRIGRPGDRASRRLSGKWQATKWPGASSRISGSSSAQTLLGLRAAGAEAAAARRRASVRGSPRRAPPARSPRRPTGRAPGSRESSAAVYGCAGRCVQLVRAARTRTACRGTSRHTRSLTFFTTARSWAMKTSVSP